MLPFVIPDQQAPFTLTAITLRGIGSYLSGARLDIKPLTVLCGKNGSGKSTWLKTLSLLKESLDKKRLPYGFSRDDSATGGLEVTNAFYFLAPPEEHERFGSLEEATDFGPPGTIGLELIASRACNLPEGPPSGAPWLPLPEVINEAGEFLWNGNCPERTHIRLRIAHPGYDGDAVDTPQLFDLIEFRLNDEYALRLVGPREPAQEFPVGQLGPKRSFPYILSCSSTFLPKTHQHLGPNVEIGELTDVNRRRWTNLREGIDTNFATMLLQHFETRFRQVVELALDGVFHIGAIRRTYDAPSLEDMTEADSQQIALRRNVGGGGQYSWRLERAFGGNRMRAVEIRSIRPDDVEGNLDRLLDFLSADELSVGRDDPRVKRIRDLAPNALWDRIMKLCASWNLNSEALRKEYDLQRDGLIHENATALHREFLKALDAASQANDKQIAGLLAEYLNSVLDSPHLFDREAWKHHFGAENGPLGLPPDPEIRYLAEIGASNLDLRVLRRFNSLLVRDTITFGQDRGFDQALAETQDTYPFVSYLSHWLSLLTEAGLKAPNARWESTDSIGEPPAHVWGNVSDVPTGLLLDPQRPSSFVDEPDDRLSRLFHPCFGSHHRGFPQPPRQFSAGFHQIFPIVVQLGLMKVGELLAIENPEVHLHPGLQLKLTESLIKHIPSGRRLIIETHSDLVVRRVLRAIMKEEDGLGQSQVGIYFADLKQEEHGYDNSTLEPLEVNDRGQIANWPEGFMDDDVKESRRMLDIMYGESSSEQDDE